MRNETVILKIFPFLYNILFLISECSFFWAPKVWQSWNNCIPPNGNLRRISQRKNEDPDIFFGLCFQLLHDIGPSKFRTTPLLWNRWHWAKKNWTARAILLMTYPIPLEKKLAKDFKLLQILHYASLIKTEMETRKRYCYSNLRCV